MASTPELINEILDNRAKAVDKLHEVVEQVEASGGHWTAEDEQKSERINREIDDLGIRAENLQKLHASAADASDQRKRFEKIIHPDHDSGDSPEEERIRNFVRAADPNSDTWAPRAIEFKITDAVKKSVAYAKRMGMSVADIEYRDLLKGTTTAGGYTVPTGFVARLYEHLVEAAGIRQTNADVLTTGSGESLLVPKTTSHGNATLVAEAGPLLENDPAFGQVTMGAYKYGQLVQVSSELASDTAIDLLGYIARAAGRNLGLLSGQHMITGTGTAGGGGAQPEGVMTNITTGATLPTGNTAGFTTAGTSADKIFDLVYSLVSGYRARGQFLTLDATVGMVRKIRDTTNNYIWQPGLTAGQPDRLLNYPIVTDPNVAAFGVTQKVMAFGDFSLYYLIRDVDTVRFERSDDFAFANDLITFRAILRTDGRVIDTNACKVLLSSAT